MATQTTNAVVNHFSATFRTPFGLFSIAVNETGAVTGTAFGPVQALSLRLGTCHLVNDH
jgi:hypothetical protein